MEDGWSEKDVKQFLLALRASKGDSQVVERLLHADREPIYGSTWLASFHGSRGEIRRSYDSWYTQTKFVHSDAKHDPLHRLSDEKVRDLTRIREHLAFTDKIVLYLAVGKLPWDMAYAYEIFVIENGYDEKFALASGERAESPQYVDLKLEELFYSMVDELLPVVKTLLFQVAPIPGTAKTQEQVQIDRDIMQSAVSAVTGVRPLLPEDSIEATQK